MSEAIGMAREGSLAGWPFWASVLTHIVGLGAVSAVAVTSASTPPPPVPIELVRLEQPAPLEVPKPKVVKAPPTTASAPVSSAPASLLDDTPRTETPAPLPDPIAPDRRLLASTAPGMSSTSDGIPAGAGALFETGDLPVAGARLERGPRRGRYRPDDRVDGQRGRSH
jgi:hypothetical protein